MQQMIIQGATIYTENEKIEKGNILIENGKIKTITTDAITQITENAKVIDGSGFNAIPGFIDGHIHGAKGADTMDATVEALDTIARALPEEGTTSFLATTMTQSEANIDKALQNVANYRNQPNHAELVGIHLEGPFIHKDKKGAQPEEHIIDADVALFKKWQQLANGLIKVVTLAPERDKEGLVTYLSENNCIASAGHTNANFKEIENAVERGVCQLTHLCNAMNGIHHRDIGAVGAAIIIPELFVEVIADEIHLSPEMLQIVYQTIGSERILLITDAMRAKGLHDGTFELGGQRVDVKGKYATLVDGTLAGSILKMSDAVKNMMKINGVTMKDIIQMTAINPAKQFHLYDRKGSITTGKDADILLVDNELTLQYTICKGELAYER